MTSITEVLAEEIMNYKLDDEALHATVRCVIDWAACALGGAPTSSVAAALGMADAGYGRSDACTIVGRRARTGPIAAALINGISSNVLDYDDYNRTHMHPGVTVIPATLAIAEMGGIEGTEVLVAVASGYEVAGRVAVLLWPKLQESRWHTTGTLGCIAAAGASARLLGLDVETTARALSLGATQAGGVAAMFGSEGKPFHAGRAASAGVLAALLAEQGYESAIDAIGGRGGFLDVIGGAELGEESTEDLTARWLEYGLVPGDVKFVREGYFKRHAACGATLNLIDAVAGVVREHEISPEDVDRIDADVFHYAVTVAGRLNPTVGLDAKFSLSHLAAQAVYVHPITEEWFTAERVTEPAVVALRNKVHIHVDDSFPRVLFPARVTLTLKDGTAYEGYSERALYTRMSDEELGKKFLSTGRSLLGVDAADAALEALWKLEEGASTTESLSRMVPVAGSTDG